MIEKHVTLDRAEGGVDSVFSLEPQELAELVRETRTASEALGTVHLGVTEEEQASRIFRRTLYICEDLKAGDRLTQKNVRAIRPGLGLPPKFIDQFVGRKISKAVKRGTPVDWELLG